MAKRGALLLSICALFTMNNALASSNHQLSIGTFNIRWFGSAEHDSSYELPSKKSERIAAIKDFIKKEMMPLDVVAFEEIVDLKALKKVLPAKWKCASYEHENDLHQHVAICASPTYKILEVPYDDDYIINEVASYDPERARPAVRVDIADQSGMRLLRMVAVHLKSAPNYARTRLMQAGIIGRELRNTTLPVVVTGDFNTYSKAETGLEADDAKLIEKQLNQSGLGFRHVNHHAQFTFRNRKYKSLFDHFYVSGAVRSTTVPQVFGVCNRETNGSGYSNREHYLRYVSDHCPVTMKLRF